jgi:1-deoxy-D-xylulose-5-phosphate synthase
MKNILDFVNYPEQVKELDIKDLSVLAEEIRQFIIETVSNTGGHLASNLGTVELTLALHYVFDFSVDKLLWDVGHQCYTHKIITGRKEAFKKLRTAEGVSGFPWPAESEYDNFTVGHAGTAIPTAIGMALASDKDDPQKIISLVGDASIVNGASFEGLNNLGSVKRQMLIILNDNSMAIDPTQGAMAEYFSRVRLSHTYEDLTSTANSILEHLPGIGKSVEQAIERIKKSIRMTFPASQLFESMDIPYFGPVDGHDISTLSNLFSELKDLNHPAILHVYTKKGKGYEPAVKEPQNYHSTPPFSIQTQPPEDNKLEEPEQIKETQPKFTNAFGDALVSLAEKDDRIVAITSAMGEGTGLGEFRKKFPNRYYDVGIAESAAVDIAAGLAKQGKKPVVCIYSTFLQRAYDQIFQEATLQGLSVIFCIDRAGLVGSDGPTHHGLMDIGFLRMLPNITLISPADDNEMQAALEYAMQANGSVAIRYPKEKIPADEYKSRWNDKLSADYAEGKSVKVIECESPKAAIVTYGCMLTEGIKACDILKDENIEAELINARFGKPISDEIIETAKKMPIVTVEDHSVTGGFGSAVLERLANENIQTKARTLGVDSKPVCHDTRAEQIKACGLDSESIAKTVKEIISETD